MTDEEWQAWFDSVCETRDVELYQDRFGDPDSEDIYAIDEKIFQALNVSELDQRWLVDGVMIFRPNDVRHSWLYVTTGLSNEWDAEEPQPDGMAGAGIELVFETTERVGWAVKLLQEVLALAVLGARSKDAIAPGQILPAARLLPTESDLTSLLTGTPSHYDADGQLEWGRFRFVHLAGITGEEADFARRNGAKALQEKLERARAWPVTDPKRKSILSS